MSQWSRKKRRRQASALVVAAATTLIASAFTAGIAHGAPAEPTGKPAAKPVQKQAAPDKSAPSAAVPLKDRDKVLGRGWKESGDRAVVSVADSDGLHLLVADSTSGYAWRTATVLIEPQVPADTWIGNSCVLDDHHAAVVYAPRTFTNKPDLMMGGAFTAVVNLDDGSVTKLPFTASLAYFDPTCNPTTHTAVFTALRDAKTRLVTVDAKGTTLADTTANGEVTSAVPTNDGVVAASGDQLVTVDRKGRTTRLTATRHAPYGIRVTGDGTVDFIDRTGDTDADVQTYAHGRKTTVANGKVTAMNLRQGTDGTVYLAGKAGHTSGFQASRIKPLDVPPDAAVSSRGRMGVDPVVSPAVRAGLDRIANAGRGFTGNKSDEPAADPATRGASHLLTVTGTVPGTGEHTAQQVAESGTTAGSTPSPALTGSSKPQVSTIAMLTATSDDDPRAHDPVDTDAWCSIPRNDSDILALQPTPNQVEWAVDMAVRGELHANYLTQGGWRSQTGLLTVDPQGMFPKPTLTGGGHIPAQVELGILAQESNLWQSESGVIPGQMGSPLAAIDGYYGHQSGGTVEQYWAIHWNESDCGYGVGQVTDGMRKAGFEKAGETSRPITEQRAIAIDYATNIAASLYILADKWNEVHQPDQTVAVNNDDPNKPENWFTAVWNYNLGFNAKADEGTNGNWGLGWYNNPANPVYPASRKAFMNTDLDPLAAKDAAHPEQWPYEEKVMGWAAWSIDTGYSYGTSGRQDWPGDSGFSSAGFRPAYWNGAVTGATVEGSARYNRAHVSPPLDTFCNSANNCQTASPPHCPDSDCYTQYWWNASNATWKPDCSTTCGFENIKYATLINEPGRGTRLQYGTPDCSGPPAGSLVVDSVPDGTQTWSSCGTSQSSGTFQFTFDKDPTATGPGLGQYDAKADLHQVGGGYQGHFWYAHTRSENTNVSNTSGLSQTPQVSGLMAVNGTWKLGEQMTGWTRVLVHLPDTGSQTQDAIYTVHQGAGGTQNRILNVHSQDNSWVSLGVFQFLPSSSEYQGVSLSNYANDGTADEDVAWDAVAFQLLPDKPKDIVVQLGDSYSSGTGAGSYDYGTATGPYASTSSQSSPGHNWNACLRSANSWAREAKLPGSDATIGSRTDALDPSLDYHSVACNGAYTYDVDPSTDEDNEGGPGTLGQYGEVGQLDSGFVNSDTTLVALTIGGNDAKFADTLASCANPLENCPSDATVQQNISDATDKIPQLLADIYDKAPNAKIILLGYPQLFDTGSLTCVSVISGSARGALNAWAGDLSDKERAAVETAKATYKNIPVTFYSPDDEFGGWRMCDSPSGINDYVAGPADDNPADFSCPGNLLCPGMESFHPNSRGTPRYAIAFQNAMAAAKY